MFGCSVNQDEQIQKRFYLYNENEDRYFEFEAVLDSDFSDWFYAIESNIEVFLSFFVDSSFWERREEISLVLTKTTIQLLALALLPRPDEFTLCLFVLIAHSQRILQSTTQQPSSSSPPSSPRRFFAI